MADTSGEVYNLLFHDATDLAGWREAVIGRHLASEDEGEEEGEEAGEEEGEVEDDACSDENGA